MLPGLTHAIPAFEEYAMNEIEKLKVSNLESEALETK